MSVMWTFLRFGDDYIDVLAAMNEASQRGQCNDRNNIMPHLDGRVVHDGDGGVRVDVGEGVVLHVYIIREHDVVLHARGV